MRIGMTLLVLAIGLGLSALVYVISDGRVAMLLLPLLFGLPLMMRRR